jgi:hypothetical protein
VNVFWLNITATTHVAADLKSIVDSMVAAYATDMLAISSGNLVQNAAKASWLYASNQVLEYTGGYSNTGALTGTIGSDAMCAVVNWSITDYYRGGHPRTYVPGIRENDIVNGRTLASGSRTTLATGATNFLSAVNALTHGGISAVALGTVRFASGNAWLSPPQFKAYQAASVRSVFGTQRRRYAAY